MSQQNSAKTRTSRLPPIFYIFLGLFCIFFLPRLWGTVQQIFSSSSDRMSIGNQLLIQASVTPEKLQGIEANARGDHFQAAEYFKDEFLATFISNGGKLVPTVCDLSTPNFEATTAVNQAVDSGANGLFISAHIDRLQTALNLARANRGHLALLSSPTMYTMQTLQTGRDVKGLILVAPWHPQANPGNPFAQKMSQRWGGKVSWRTAMAYDATQAIIAGLNQSHSRDGLQQVLRSPGFTAKGASDTVKFSTSGDRIGRPVIVQVKPSSTGYEFALSGSH